MENRSNQSRDREGAVLNSALRTPHSAFSDESRAFTLVELLVVIGIIGILIAVLLPAMGSIRRTAKTTDTQATFNTLSAGLETYKKVLEVDYPPSNSDAAPLNVSDANYGEVSSPYDDTNNPPNIAITGANLLAYALMGADLLGTPGFKDVSTIVGGGSASNGLWWNDMHAYKINNTTPPYGLYALNDSTPDLKPHHRRYDAFVDPTKTRIANMKDYAEDVLKPRGDYPNDGGGGADTLYEKQIFLLDGFGYPILYYKATPGQSYMVEDLYAATPTRGVYNQADNRLYTGEYVTDGLGGGTNSSGFTGMDLGAGLLHKLFLPNGESVVPDPRPAGSDLQGETNVYAFTFAKFIWDKKVTARNEAVNRDSYLLISPGADALWGTEDDITNFKN